MAEERPTISRRRDIWLLITAHPDDESMFFVPSIKALCFGDPTNAVHLLCLSNGDYRDAADGPLRTRELLGACSVIGIRNGKTGEEEERGARRSSTVTVIDDERMRDGPNEVWNPAAIAEVVLEHVRGVVMPSAYIDDDDDDDDASTSHPAHDCLLTFDPGEEEVASSWRYAEEWSKQRHSSTSIEATFDRSTTNLNVLTFDRGGVSGHPNHVDVHRGIRCLLNEKCDVVRDDEGRGPRTMLRLRRKENDPVIVEVNVTVHTLRTMSNPFQKYLLWAFADIIPFLLVRFFQTLWYLSYLLMGGFLLGMGNPRIQPFSRVLSPDADSIQCRIMDPILVWRAMAAHYSQFVWYRRLSVVFSRYTYINDIQRMTIDAHTLVDDDASGDDDYARGDDNAIAPLPPVVIEKEEDASPEFILAPTMIDALRAAVLPPTLHHRPWKRIYSLARDGDSFVAFRKLMEEWDRGTGHQSSLIVIKTASGDVIGGYSDVPIVPLASAAGLSAARSCLFRLNNAAKDTAVEVYGKNCTTSSKRMVFDATRRIIAFGSGDDGVGGSDGGFGLCLNDGFARGTTARCSAYQSEALVSDRGGVFDVLDVEVWGFLFGRI